MSDEQQDVALDGPAWYISDRHARRAIGYLTAALPALHDVPVPEVAEAWGEALERTIDPDEPSPIPPPLPREEQK